MNRGEGLRRVGSSWSLTAALGLGLEMELGFGLGLGLGCEVYSRVTPKIQIICSFVALKKVPSQLFQLLPTPMTLPKSY